MASPRIYLDYNATAPLRREGREAALQAMDGAGNASSVHAEGRQARHRIETARRQVAALTGALPEQVVFTSGGTEAAALALAPVVRPGAASLDRLLIGASEHAAVLHGHRFGPDAVDTVPVDADGRIRLDRLEALLRSGGPAVLAVQAANNETGVLQPVREAADLVHAAGGILVCDAVQAAGRIACTAQALGADVVLLSAHKLGGLQGAGAVVTIGQDLKPEPLWRGGGQERGNRGGTENVPAIAAFGAVAELSASFPDAGRLAGLRDRFEAELARLRPDVVLFGRGGPRLPNTSAFAVPGIAAERLMIALDLGGIAVSSGSACSSGKVGRSHVLEAMGVGPDLRSGAIRVSLGWRSTESDVEDALTVLAEALGRMTKRMLLAAA